MNINIRVVKIENGYVVHYEDLLNGDTEWTWQQYCIQVDEDASDGWKKAFQELCYFVNDIIGVSYDKFGAENLSVEWNRLGSKIDNEIEGEE